MSHNFCKQQFASHVGEPYPRSEKPQTNHQLEFLSPLFTDDINQTRNNAEPYYAMRQDHCHTNITSDCDGH